jgi:peptidyl-prolyl cis-trans isomerase D
MERFRRLPENIFFKLFLGILLATFIFFGVTDFVFGVGKRNVAEVGKERISLGNFYGMVNKERNRLLKRGNGNGTADFEYINSKELKYNVLNEEVNRMLLAQEADNFHLYSNDEAIVEFIVSSPLFADTSGSFSRPVFESFLNNSGLSEKEYIDYMKDIFARNALVSSISNIDFVDKETSERVYKYRGEKRKIDVVTINRNSVNSQVKSPTNEEIEEFYNRSQSMFYTPEFRKVSYVEIDPKRIFANVTVSEAEIREEYEQNSSMYSKPETRDLYFIRSNNVDEINEVYSKLGDGADFVTLAMEVNDVDKSRFSIKKISRDGLDKNFARVIFDTEKGDYTDIIKGGDEFYIFYVSRINSYKESSFAEARGGIKKYLKAQKREDLFSEFITKLEDKLLLANSLEELAKEFKLTVKKVAKFDLNGKTAGGKNVDVSKIKNLISLSFEMGEGQFSELILENNKYYVVFVNKVYEAGLPEFADIKMSVRKALIREKQDEALIKLSENIRKQIKDTGNIDMVAMRNNLRIRKSITVSKVTMGYSKEFMDDIFSRTIGALLTQPYKEGEGVYKLALLRNVIKVKKVDVNDAVEIRNEFNRGISEEIVNKYREYLIDKMGMSINYNLVETLD